MPLRTPVSILRMTLACVLLPGFALPAAAQSNLQNPAGAAAQPETKDPLGRETPRGTITGLGLAVHRHDAAAERYLQIPPAQRRNAEQLARDLTDLIERYYLSPLTALSNDPEGLTTDSLPHDRERVALTIDDSKVDLELVRVKDREAGLIWLVSAQTVAQVPRLHETAGSTRLERLVPSSLAGKRVFGLSAARLAAWVVTLVLPFVVLWLLSVVVGAFIRWTGGTRRALIESWFVKIRWLVISLLTIAVHGGLIRLLGFSLQFRLTYSRIAIVAAVIAATWLLWRVMALSFIQARTVAARRGHVSLQSLLLLAEQVSKTLLILLAGFVLLTIAGVDTATALAGVGLGGVAVALGAQKSVENLLGGVFLVTDRAIAVGDFCSISDRQGVVEDITMRSVRLRTVEQTLLSVPTGVLSQSSLENFATRKKILIHTTVRLRYGTTTDQLRCVLRGIQRLLDEHADIEKTSARIRLVDFSVRAIELELFAYVLTSDWLKFLAVREEVLLRIAAIVESADAGFAQVLVPDAPAAG